MIKNMKITKIVTTCDNKKTISFRCVDNGFVFFVHVMKLHSSGIWELRIKVSSVSWFPEEFISEEQFHEYNECLYYKEISSLIAKALVEYVREILQNVVNDDILVSQSLQELGVLDKHKRSYSIDGIGISPKAENDASVVKFEGEKSREFSIDDCETAKYLWELYEKCDIPKPKIRLDLLCDLNKDLAELESEPRIEEYITSLLMHESSRKLNEIANELDLIESDENPDKDCTNHKFVPGKVYVFEEHPNTGGFNKLIDIALGILNNNWSIMTQPFVFFINAHDLSAFRDKVQKIPSTPRGYARIYMEHLGTDEIEEWIRTSKLRLENTSEKPAVVFIDNLHSIFLSNKTLAKMEDIIRELKSIASYYQVPIIIRQQVPASVEPKVVVDTAYWLENPRNGGNE